MEEIYCFAGNRLDRAAPRRADAAWVGSLLEDPATRILPLVDLKPGLGHDSPPRLEWRPVSPWRKLIEEGAVLIFLGLDDEGRAHFALDATAGGNTAGALADVREVAPTLAASEAAVLAEARSLIDWHARHGFCAACGGKSAVACGGWQRHCPNCGAHHFPRTDPVVIMLAVSGERCLLGRNRRRPGNRFSCLAGFMDPGESLEEAVRREVFEESGVRIGRVRYLASQPWPFPSNLMMGFLAEAVSEEITVDPEEIAEARWFERDEIRAMVARAARGEEDPSRPALPGPIAIAHQICRRWSLGLDGI
ncbi:MAG TPA: NAD(+) diphosphatase [Stellaceae bacterium]|nr:NAD(+) diphosphatase [Stellaceae bacterium]